MSRFNAKTLLSLAAVLLGGCPEINVLAQHQDIPFAAEAGPEVCTAANSIDPGQPADRRCIQTHCYSNDQAPTRTVGVAQHVGDGDPQAVPIQWAGIRWLGTVPEHFSLVGARGAGCYDCPEKEIGFVSHRVALDDIGAAALGSPVNATEFGCTLLNRPHTASLRATDAALASGIERCIRQSWGAVPDRKTFPTMHTWNLDFIVGDGDARPRARLGACLAELCADLNTFDVDRDRDGIGDVCDNCGERPNANQSNIAGSWRGDVCDDTDQDGIADDTDNCVFTANPDQSDFNANGRGDACNDADGDGTPDADDPCPERSGVPGRIQRRLRCVRSVGIHRGGRDADPGRDHRSAGHRLVLAVRQPAGAGLSTLGRTWARRAAVRFGWLETERAASLGGR
jgi:hypothetical protein